MSWKPIIAGVDPSPEGAWAGATAWRLAQAARAPCHLVYVIQGTAIPPGSTPGTPDDDAFRAAVLPVAREEIRQALKDNVPAGALNALEIWFGLPGQVLTRLAAERQASLLVVGGKHHSRLERWVAGSTALDTVRATTVPTLVATASTGEVRRILVAVDFSPVAERTVQTAWRLAQLVGARLRLVHAVEPTTTMPSAPAPPVWFDAAEAMERLLPAGPARREVERVVRPGWALDVIMDEARRWGAQLVVAGTEGKDWIDRVMLGSVTEALLREIPASLLVVPPGRSRAARPAEPAGRGRAEIASR